MYDPLLNDTTLESCEEDKELNNKVENDTNIMSIKDYEQILNTLNDPDAENIREVHHSKRQLSFIANAVNIHKEGITLASDTGANETLQDISNTP